MKQRTTHMHEKTANTSMKLYSRSPHTASAHERNYKAPALTSYEMKLPEGERSPRRTKVQGKKWEQLENGNEIAHMSLLPRCEIFAKVIFQNTFIIARHSNLWRSFSDTSTFTTKKKKGSQRFDTFQSSKDQRFPPNSQTLSRLVFRNVADKRNEPLSEASRVHVFFFF